MPCLIGLQDHPITFCTTRCSEAGHSFVLGANLESGKKEQRPHNSSYNFGSSNFKVMEFGFAHYGKKRT